MNNISPEQVEALLKAVTADNISGLQTVDQSLTTAPLKVEDLEQTVRSLETRLQDIKLYNAMPKLVAKQNVVQYVLETSFGGDTGMQSGRFYDETELPTPQDHSNERKVQITKNMYEEGQVSLLAQEVEAIADAKTQATNARLMSLMRKAAESVYNGNSDVNGSSWNGLYKQHFDAYGTLNDYDLSGKVVDLRGKSLTQYDIENASVSIDEGNRTPTHVFSTPGVISGLSQTYFNTQRTLLNAGTPLVAGNNVPMGIVTAVIPTTFGNVQTMPEKFAKRARSKRTTDLATSASAPASVVPDATTPVAVAVDASSKYSSADTAPLAALGGVYYGVVAFNKEGESALVVLDTDLTTLVSGSSVDLEWASGGGAFAPTGYRVYRSKVTTALSSAVEFFPIFEITPAQLAAGYDGGAATKARDRGRILPGAQDAFITEVSDNTIAMKELTKFSKIDFARTSLVDRFLVMYRATPILYANRGFVKFINAAEGLVA